MFTVMEIAKRLRISPALAYALVEAGKMPHYRIGLGRGSIRVSEEQLARFLNECEEKIAEPHRPAPPVKPRLTLRHINLSPSEAPREGSR